MKLLNKGFFQLIQLVLLPIVLFLPLLCWLLGWVFFWSLLLFTTGSFFLLTTFSWIRYRPKWFRWLDRQPFFRQPSKLVIFILLFLWLVALHVSMLSLVASESFCLAIFGAYFTINWILYRLVTSHLLVYTRYLQTDTFNSKYWFFNFKTLRKKAAKKRSILGQIKTFFAFKKVTAPQQVKAIEILLERQFFHSIQHLQDKAFQSFDLLQLDFSVQKRMLETIHELPALIGKEGLSITLKEKNSSYFKAPTEQHFQAMLDPTFQKLWYAYGQQFFTQQAFLFLYYEYLGQRLSKFIANPSPTYFKVKTLAFIKQPTIPTLSKEVLQALSLQEENSLKEAIQYAHSLLLIAHGIANNLD